MMKKNSLSAFITLSRPVFMLGGMGQYFLGVGIARYLGFGPDWGLILLGAVWAAAMQLTVHYLTAYFEEGQPRGDAERMPFFGPSGAVGEGEGQVKREAVMTAAGTAMTAAALVTIWLVRLGVFNGGLALVMGLIFLAAVLYAMPPVRLNRSGYGELIAAAAFGYLVPTFGFMLQSGGNHRLVLMSGLPLLFLLLALQLAAAFPQYASDLKYGRKNLLVLAGWENGMVMHNTFVLLAFVVLGLAGLFGLPPGIGLPAFIPLPLGLLQVWTMRRIGQGAPPNWRNLVLNALALVGLMMYLFVFAFWSR